MAFPQFRAGCDVFDPVIQRGGIIENTARPKTFDQNSPCSRIYEIFERAFESDFRYLC